MKEIFTEPAQQKMLDEAKALLPDLEDKASARREFVEQDPLVAGPGGGEQGGRVRTFFKEDGNELMKNLKVDEDDLDDEVAGTGGSAVTAARRGRDRALCKAERRG